MLLHSGYILVIFPPEEKRMEIISLLLLLLWPSDLTPKQDLASAAESVFTNR